MQAQSDSREHADCPYCQQGETTFRSSGIVSGLEIARRCLVDPSARPRGVNWALWPSPGSARLAPVWKEGSDMNPIRLPPFSRLPCASCTDVLRIT